MKNNFPIILLSGALIKENDKYLLVQEKNDKPYSKCKDKWTLPHGSYDHDRESIMQLAQREILEETGGKAEYNGDHICIEGWGKISKRVILVCITFLGNNWNKIGERFDDEIKDVSFFSKDEIIEMQSKGEIRDNIPIIKIIEAFEKKDKGIIRWEVNI